MVSEKIRILLIKRKMTMSELADKIGITPQNLSNKLKRDNFSENELISISNALNCKIEITFKMEESNERV